MRYALVGYGKMGHAIEDAATARGHARALIVDPGARKAGASRGVAAARWRAVEVAFEFTEPGSARANVLELLARNIAVVCGTTAWDPDDREIAGALRRSRGALLVAPNFSIGMALYLRVVAAAAAAFAAAPGFDPWVVERHHRGKKDAPSGTARRLARVVSDASAPKASIVEGPPEGALAPGAVHVASVRAGHEPGRHEVGFDGPHDTITLVHEARGRGGFAEGAVLAAEWLRGRRGRHAFDEVVDDLLRLATPRARGGRRR